MFWLVGVCMKRKRVILVKKKTEVISYPLVKRIITKCKVKRTRALLAFQYATAARAGELAWKYWHEVKKFKFVKGRYVVKSRVKESRLSRGPTINSFQVHKLGLSWNAPNFKNRRNAFKKAYVFRKEEFWLFKILVDWLKYKKSLNKRYLFHLGERRIRQLVDAELKKYDKGFSSHVLRHSRGTHLAELTENPFVVKDSLGHARLETSQQYIHLSKREIRSKLMGKSFEDILGKEV